MTKYNNKFNQCVNYKCDKLYDEYKILLFINYYTVITKCIKVYKDRDL